MGKLVIVQLKDRNNLYSDTCVKIYGKDFGDALKKLEDIDINKAVEKDFSEKNYDFEPVSYYDIDSMTELK